MKFGELWKNIKKSWIVSAILTGVIGLILLLFPSATLLSVCYCIGGLIIAMGVIRVVRYFRNEHAYPYLFQSDLVVGLITIGLGIFMVTQIARQPAAEPVRHPACGLRRRQHPALC